MTVFQKGSKNGAGAAAASNASPEGFTAALVRF
jgi:hypothetical protein